MSSLPARSLIVAPRLPPKPELHTGNPFTTLGDVVADCQVEGCGYHVMGPRADVKKAIDAHHAMWHSEDTVVVILNSPTRQ
jgi:hypothetical protein